MARRVFFSFHYANDINRSMTVRNSWVTQGKEAAGFIDKAEFEQIKRQGDKAVHNWIDRQMEGTSVTVVLRFVKVCKEVTLLLVFILMVLRI